MAEQMIADAVERGPDWALAADPMRSRRVNEFGNSSKIKLLSSDRGKLAIIGTYTDSSS